MLNIVLGLVIFNTIIRDIFVTDHDINSATFTMILSLLISRGGSRAAATSKIERFVIIVNGYQPLTIITKRSILDVTAVLDPPLIRAKCSLQSAGEDMFLILSVSAVTSLRVIQ